MIAAAFPASAVAAPDKTSELSADLPKFEWTGEGTGVPIDALHVIPGDPFGCDTPGHDCDYILLDVKHPGTVKLNVAADGAQAEDLVVIGVSYPDIDVYFYASDKDGVPQGDSLTETECATGAVAETCEAKDLKPGLYVVEVSFFLADAATYKGSVELSTSVPPTPPGAPAAPQGDPPPAQPAPAPPAEQQQQQQQQQQPMAPYSADEPKPAAKKESKKKSKKKSRKAACQKKAKKIKNKGKRKKALKRCAKLKG